MFLTKKGNIKDYRGKTGKNSNMEEIGGKAMHDN